MLPPAAPLLGWFRAERGWRVKPVVALLDSMDSMLDSYKSSDPLV